MNCCRIVLTGGPGGGKTTAADLFRRELGERVVVVPESATILYSGGFPRSTDIDVKKRTQLAIYQVQQRLEEVQETHFRDRILLCDRGTLDGAAYWPNSIEGFLKSMGTTLEAEYARYDAVIFFETAAVGGMSIEGGNPIRTETMAQAVEIDRKLKSVWEKHPRFVHIPHHPSFLHKITMGLKELSFIAGSRDRSTHDS